MKKFILGFLGVFTCLFLISKAYCNLQETSFDIDHEMELKLIEQESFYFFPSYEMEGYRQRDKYQKYHRNKLKDTVKKEQEKKRYEFQRSNTNRKKNT